MAQAFSEDELIYVRKIFISGYSGATVLLVSAGADQPPTVVKLAHANELLREHQAYQKYVSRISPQDIAHVRGEPLVAEDGQLGLIQYTFVGGHATAPAVSLHDYYLTYGAAAATDVLNRIFRVFGRHWWANNRPHIYALGEQYDRLLTAHLQIVRVAHPVGMPHVLQAGQASMMSLRTLEVGQFVQLLGFEVVKVEAAGTKLTLSAPAPSNEAAAVLRIKVDTTEPLLHRPGEPVAQIDGVVIATRQTVLNGIARTVLPTHRPDEKILSIPSTEEVHKRHGIQLLNPLYAFDELLDRVMETRFSVIHGDLNLQNVLVDGETGFAWLIDFAETRTGPTVFDLQRLEVQAIIKLLPPAISASGLGPEAVIDLMASLHWDPPQQNAPHGAFGEPYAVMVTLRRLARQYLVDDLDWDEYYLGLVIALVGALKYDELDEVARTLALFAAATARGLIGQPLKIARGEQRGQGTSAGDASIATTAPEPPAPPPEPDDFVGRETELENYAEQLRSTGVAVITGMTGVGKTALAATLVRRISTPQRTFWYSFGSSEGLDDLIWKLASFLYWNNQPELWQMLREVQVTGKQPPPVSVLFDYVVQMLPGRGYLLCLDNFHFVNQDPLLSQVADRLRPLTKAKEVSLLLISQSLPNLTWTAVPEPLGGLSYEDTCRLLTVRNITLDEELLQALYSCTEGNVLFLDIALNALAGEPNPEELLEYLRESTALETTLFEKLDAKLSDQERDIVSAIAVLGGPCTRHHVETILGAGNLRRTLHDLSQRNLLTTQRRGAEPEYIQHTILRNFYYDQPTRERRRQMHLHAGELFEHEESNLLLAAHHYEKAQAYSKSVQIATENVRLLIGLYQARRLAELLARFDVKRLSKVESIKVNAALGQVYAFLGERVKAESCYAVTNSQLEWMDSSQEVCELRADVFHGMGQLLYNEAPADALVWLQRAFDELEQFSGQNKLEREAALLIDMGWAHRRLLNVAEALDALQRGLERLPRRPSHLRGDALTRLAALYVSQYDLVNARQYAQMAVENSRHLNDVWHEQTVRVMLGTIKHSGCDWSGAVDEYKAALTLATEIGDRAAQVALEVNLGIAHTNLGNTEPAHAHLMKGLNLSQKLHLRNYELKAQLAVARLNIRTGKWVDAQNQLLAAEELVETTGTTEAKFHLPLILSARAELQLALGKTEEALALANASVTMAIEQEKQVDRAICQRVLAHVLVARGAFHEAADLLAQSLALLEGRHEYEAAKIKATMAECMLRMGDRAHADQLVEEARLAFELHGARFDLAELAQRAGVQFEQQ
jgi:tetratricopeptide (TPR) repeat protein